MILFFYKRGGSGTKKGGERGLNRRYLKLLMSIGQDIIKVDHSKIRRKGQIMTEKTNNPFKIVRC